MSMLRSTGLTSIDYTRLMSALTQSGGSASSLPVILLCGRLICIAEFIVILLLMELKILRCHPYTLMGFGSLCCVLRYLYLINRSESEATPYACKSPLSWITPRDTDNFRRTRRYPFVNNFLTFSVFDLLPVFLLDGPFLASLVVMHVEVSELTIGHSSVLIWVLIAGIEAFLPGYYASMWRNNMEVSDRTLEKAQEIVLLCCHIFITALSG